MSEDNQEWLIVAEVAKKLSVSKMTVYRMITVGEFPAYQFGRAFRIKPEDLEAYINKSLISVKAKEE